MPDHLCRPAERILAAAKQRDSQIATAESCPGGEDDEEGLVHFGIAASGGEKWHREEHFGPIGRDGVRIAALRAALDMLRKTLDLAA